MIGLWSENRGRERAGKMSLPGVFLVFFLFVLPFLFSLMFTSCTQKPAVSKAARLSAFAADLNSAMRSGIEGNFISGASADRPAFAISFLPEGASYKWVQSGSLADKITGEFRLESDSSYICTAEFFFENTQNNIFESEQWMIERLEIWNSTLPTPDHFIYR